MQNMIAGIIILIREICFLFITMGCFAGYKMKQREKTFDKGGITSGDADSVSSVSEVNYFFKVENVSMHTLNQRVN